MSELDEFRTVFLARQAGDRLRWDGEKAVRAVLGVASLAVLAFVFATTEPTYYLHLPAALGIVMAVWILLSAVVPVMRGEGPLMRRALVVVVFWAVAFGAGLIVGRLRI
jgi:hypothetical protein